jgi:hypothetical protein
MNDTVLCDETGIEPRWWRLSAPVLLVALLLLSVILFFFLSVRGRDDKSKSIFVSVFAGVLVAAVSLEMDGDDR